MEYRHSAEWEEMYRALRSEERTEREAATAALVAAVAFEITPAQFIAQGSVEPFAHPDGGTLWVDLGQNWILSHQERIRLAFRQAGQATEYVVSSVVNQVLLVPQDAGESWWDKSFRGICGVPILAIWDRS